MGLNDVRFIEVPTASDSRGCLSYIRSMTEVPFEIKEVYYIYNVPAGAVRGCHSHRTACHVLVALNGSVTVSLDDGVDKAVYMLDSPRRALYMPAGLWLGEFNVESLCLVVSSELYSEDEYIRDYDEYLRFRGLR